jgi:hypothetical protein
MVAAPADAAAMTTKIRVFCSSGMVVFRKSEGLESNSIHHGDTELTEKAKAEANKETRNSGKEK